MGTEQLVFALTMGAFVALAEPRLASACSCERKAEIIGLREGAADVPVDIAPMLRGFSFDSNAVRWQTEAGVAVPFTVRGGGAGPYACSGQLAELTPNEPLAPNTRYVISVPSGSSSGDLREIRFTTGERKVPEQPLQPPALTITLLHGNPIRDSCLSPIHGCIDVDDVSQERMVEVAFLDAADNVLGWMVDATSVLERAFDATCVEARTRDVAGRRSAPVRRCGEELAKREARASDFVNYRLQCRAGRVIASLGSDASTTDAPPNDAGAADANDGMIAESGSADSGAQASPETDGNDESAGSSEQAGASRDGDGCRAGGMGGQASSAAWWMVALVTLSSRGWRRLRKSERA